MLPGLLLLFKQYNGDAVSLALVQVALSVLAASTQTDVHLVHVVIDIAVLRGTRAGVGLGRGQPAKVNQRQVQLENTQTLL